MPIGSPLPNAPEEYSKEEERSFRGNLQITLSEIADSLRAIQKNSGSEAAKTMQMVSQLPATAGVPGLDDGDLDFRGDTGTGSVVLDGQTLDIAGGTNITTSAASQDLTVNLDASIGGLTSVTSTNFVGALGSCTGLPLTTGVTGTLPILNGGTAGTTASAARTNLGFDSYLTAYRSFPAAWLTRYITGFASAAADQVWVADADVVGASGVTTWTTEESSEWADGSGDGEFVYSGTDTRMFLITWHLNMWYFLQNVYTPLMGGVFLDDDGGGFDLIPGSAQLGHGYFDYTLGVFSTYISGISGGSVVEIANGDKVRFQFGFQVLSGTNTTGIVHLYASGTGDPPGMTINIVPVT